MTKKATTPINPLRNTTGGAVGVIITLMLVVAIAAGGGYYAYDKYYKKEPLRTKLASMKMKEELIRFTHDRVSRALYHNLVTLDGIVVMMNKELDRLKRIAKKFPDQKSIITPQTKELTQARDHLNKVLKEVTVNIEKIYVTWLVDRSTGTGQIQSTKGTLTRKLANAIRGKSDLVARIRTNPKS